eukprot:CAMPEP_0114226768 /NCGR_PEP_ID=MMETSP0058-20121206/1415_1 /TAXON_ID=36894 /ORGANISM="Pyramimonas parkeae, CCMP726" /LENGTH=122 /DNA_ID=CAMNT_0001337529 /DNA_START=117 /DNA_END=482 /DNA_ORIENTATION=+
MASTAFACSGLVALPARVVSSRRNARVSAKAPVKAARVAPTMSLKKEAVATVAPMVSLAAASPVFAAQEVAQVAMETNILGLIATALFVIIPTSFLIVLFVKSESDGNRSGGFSQSYYDKSV